MEDRDGASAVRVHLSSADSYTLRDPIRITFELKNTATQAYQLLTWATPFEEEVTDFLESAATASWWITTVG